MKNHFYIPYDLDQEELEILSESALAVQIRLIAHRLDKQMQFSETRKNIKFSETQLKNLFDRLNIYIKNYGEHKPEIQWALEIKTLYEKAVETEENFQYPWLPKDKTVIPQEQFDKLLLSRRSIRCFNREEISDILLKKIIEYGTWAPNTCNMQGIRYIIVKSPQIKEKINDGGFSGKMGYCILAVVADFRFYDDANIDGPVHDSAAAIQNILIACHYYDIGACYVSDLGADSKEIRTLLDIKESEKITALIWMGKYDKMPLIPVRRNIEDVLEFK